MLTIHMQTRLKCEPLVIRFSLLYFHLAVQLIRGVQFIQSNLNQKKEINLKFRSIDIFIFLIIIQQYNTLFYLLYLTFFDVIYYLLDLQLILDNSEFESNIKYSQIKNQHISLNISQSFKGEQSMLFLHDLSLINIHIMFKQYFLRLITKSLVAYHNHKMLGKLFIYMLDMSQIDQLMELKFALDKHYLANEFYLFLIYIKDVYTMSISFEWKQIQERYAWQLYIVFGQ
ncbi:unnamed protein product (macronuclear) [Paramecium tetraurelia]|uniref:Transmembrane protein n=1 Tax=Paramecium tetraurelia TaxID=5888 RepID=A0BTU6_PARTE|nr:uncharacterized protein GSPATT00032195001 [Paramecium tetraurelia]CAK61963.1 unnamed protein product [Paramecium tetraurelia]|eukprot:XP_001429361.1 hypothetical protein (macronuclear) [Paramecium tetraurelia strain d4-2]